MGWLPHCRFTCHHIMSLKEFLLAGIVAVLIATSIQNSYAETVTQPAILTYSLLGNAYGCGNSTEEPPSGLLVCYMAGYRAQYPNGNFHSEYLNDSCARTNTSTSCTLHFTQTTTFDAQRTYTINKVYSCDTGGTLLATNPKTCQYTVPSCTPPQVLNSTSTACVSPPCVKGCNGACGSYYSLGASLPPQACIDNCNYSILDGIAGTSGGWIGLVGHNQGTQCTPPPPAPTNAQNTPEYDCVSKGQSYGTVNGAVVCVNKGTAGSAPTAEVKEAPATTTTPAPTPENPNPEPVTSQGSPTVVVTTPPPAGSPAGTGSTVTSSQTSADGAQTQTTESQERFCNNNPTSKLCKAETICQENPTGPTCKHLCEKFPESVACVDSDDFLEKLVGNPDDINADEVGEKTVNIGEDFNFNPISMPENSSCPSPQTMTIAGAPITISFDWLCEYASSFKLLIKAWALFLAYGIVAAAIRGDAQPYQRGLF
jgi:hypothetical protein